MFAYFRGSLASALPEEAVIDVSGVGYRLLISASTYRKLPLPGEEVLLYSHLSVREDAMQLYGFFSEAERQLFRLLLLTTGVGPRLALAILSGMPVQEVHEAIMTNAPEKLYGITGVGKKTAARIILELRDRILKMPVASTGIGTSAGGSGVSSTQVRDDAVGALLTLGFTKPVAQKAVMGILGEYPHFSTEEVIKSALVAIHNS
ncbi:MAG: Holliday junction branch migration protein RuvA [Chlorobiaceae bacterium]|nr:Holliday junction branch migration protein RuvA [Chlorobiaceae bacterium]